MGDTIKCRETNEVQNQQIGPMGGAHRLNFGVHLGSVAERGRVLRGYGLTLGVLILVMSCAPIHKEGFTGLDLRGGHVVFYAPTDEVKLFDSPVALNVATYALPARVPFQMCKTALHRAAGTTLHEQGADSPFYSFERMSSESKKLWNKYNNYIRKAFEREQVIIDENASAYLRITLKYDDVPDRLSGGPVRMCHIEAVIEVSASGRQSVAWMPDASFESGVRLYEATERYEARPEHLHSAFLEILNKQVASMAATFRGDVKEPCGYFQEHPLLCNWPTDDSGLDGGK